MSPVDGTQRKCIVCFEATFAPKSSTFQQVLSITSGIKVIQVSHDVRIGVTFVFTFGELYTDRWTGHSVFTQQEISKTHKGKECNASSSELILIASLSKTPARNACAHVLHANLHTSFDIAATSPSERQLPEQLRQSDYKHQSLSCETLMHFNAYLILHITRRKMHALSLSILHANLTRCQSIGTDSSVFHLIESLTRESWKRFRLVCWISHRFFLVVHDFQDT